MTPGRLQAWFDLIWQRAKNPARAYTDLHGCSYRMDRVPEGLPCFVGALIPDDEYTPEVSAAIEAMAVYDILPFVPALVGATQDEVTFLYEAQVIHDGVSPGVDWETALRRLASNWGLVAPAEPLCAGGDQ